MTAPTLPICERLVGELPSYTETQAMCRDARETIEALYKALAVAETMMSATRVEINRLRAAAKLREQEPATLNVAIYDAKTALTLARK